MENWQDIVLTLGNLVLFFALLPSVFSKDKPAISTSVMTGSILLLFGAVFASLELWTSMAAISLVGLTWLVLAVQKFRQNKTIKQKV